MKIIHRVAAHVRLQSRYARKLYLIRPLFGPAHLVGFALTLMFASGPFMVLRNASLLYQLSVSVLLLVFLNLMLWTILNPGRLYKEAFEEDGFSCQNNEREQTSRRQ